MTIKIKVDALTFEFDNTWSVSKYDHWQFYRQFRRIRNGIKATDLLAVSDDSIAYLIEVKDYRAHGRSKPSEVSDEVIAKVFDTLAALVPARINATDKQERHVAGAVARSDRLRVVLHLEQPAKHSKLFPRAIDPADVEQKLKQGLKPIDAHPKVSEISRMRDLPWAVF